MSGYLYQRSMVGRSSASYLGCFAFYIRTRMAFLLMPDQRKVIAIVDDEQTMLKAIERLLTARGFATRCFASAEEFLDSRSAQDADCLVLDIHLDGMSGIELQRRLKAVRSKLPVIFITAVDDQSVHREAIEVGGVACLHKPFQSSLLIDAIDNAIA